MPQSVVDSREVGFVERVEKDNLQALSLDELAHRFEEIEQQGQLLQGKILLEARERFRSDNDFGAWIEQAGGAICSTSRQHRTRLMNLARFFEGRELDKISISAAYEISAPINADIAVEVYEYAKDKNLPLAEVKRQIAIRKGESLSIPAKPPESTTEITSVTPKSATDISNPPQIVANPIEKSKVEVIMNEVLAGMTDGEKRHILNDCLKSLSLYPIK